MLLAKVFSARYSYVVLCRRSSAVIRAQMRREEQASKCWTRFVVADAAVRAKNSQHGVGRVTDARPRAKSSSLPPPPPGQQQSGFNNKTKPGGSELSGPAEVLNNDDKTVDAETEQISSSSFSNSDLNK